MTAKKKRDYLDALDDPTLNPGRRLALLLLSYVRDIRLISEDVSSLADFDQEESRLKETLECVNCGKEINVEGSGIYCSEYCGQMAGTVRYVRRGIAAEREGNIEFQIGLGDRLNHLPNGGYPARDRLLSKGIRDAIFERDNRICRICCVKPAEQIDHISGSSNDPSNLQAVCADCNRKKSLCQHETCNSRGTGTYRAIIHRYGLAHSRAFTFQGM